MAGEGTAARYRDRAAKLRELATQSRDSHTRAEQMKMAEQFDRLAQHVETQENKKRQAEGLV
jgi:hypothetical protein